MKPSTPAQYRAAMKRRQQSAADKETRSGIATAHASALRGLPIVGDFIDISIEMRGARQVAADYIAAYERKRCLSAPGVHFVRTTDGAEYPELELALAA